MRSHQLPNSLYFSWDLHSKSIYYMPAVYISFSKNGDNKMESEMLELHMQNPQNLLTGFLYDPVQFQSLPIFEYSGGLLDTQTCLPVIIFPLSASGMEEWYPFMTYWPWQPELVSLILSYLRRFIKIVPWRFVKFHLTPWLAGDYSFGFGVMRFNFGSFFARFPF